MWAYSLLLLFVLELVRGSLSKIVNVTYYRKHHYAFNAAFFTLRVITMTLSIHYNDDSTITNVSSVLHGSFFFGMLVFGVYGGRKFLSQLKQETVHRRFINFMIITGALACVFLTISVIVM